MEKLVLTRNETAQVLNISPRHLTNLIRKGEIPCVRLGRRLVVPIQALEEFLSRRAVGEK